MAAEPTVASTLQLAMKLHHGQRYGTEPYFNHVWRVAERLRLRGIWASQAGLLHDAVEDTAMTLRELRELGYHDQVVGAVDSVSLRPGEQYDALIARACAHPLGCMVKLADNLDNTARLYELHRTEPEWAARLRIKYASVRDTLMLALVNHDARAQREGIRLGGPVMPDYTSENHDSEERSIS